MFAGLMVFNNSSTSVTNHFYFSLRTHTYIERNVLTPPDAYPYVNTHTHTVYEHIQAYKYSYTELHPAYRAKCFFPSHLSVFPLSLNSFGMLNDCKSVEDTATDVSGIHLSAKPECVCVCSCVFLQVSKQRDSPVNISFQYAASPLRCIAMLTTETCRDALRVRQNTNNTHTHRHTHTCSVSRRSCRLRGSRLQRFRAGATTVQTHLPSGSDAVLYTCQPSSEPGYKPCTQTGSMLMKSRQEQHVSCAFNRGEGQQSQTQ